MTIYLTRESIEDIRVSGGMQNTPDHGDFMVFNHDKTPDWPEGWVCRKGKGKEMVWCGVFSKALEYMEIKEVE